MSKAKSGKGAKTTTKTKQRAEKAKSAATTKLIPELTAMQFAPTMVAKLEALSESDQETILNYVNSGVRAGDAYKRVAGGRRPAPVEPEVNGAEQAPEMACHCGVVLVAGRGSGLLPGLRWRGRPARGQL